MIWKFTVTNNLIQPLGLHVMKLTLLLKTSVETFSMHTPYIPVQLWFLIHMKKKISWKSQIPFHLKYNKKWAQVSLHISTAAFHHVLPERFLPETYRLQLLLISSETDSSAKLYDHSWKSQMSPPALITKTNYWQELNLH